MVVEQLRADDLRRVGPYRLEARLGAGGMGRVYLGFSPAGRAVAVKVIHPELAHDEAFLARFRREVAGALQVLVREAWQATAPAAPPEAVTPGEGVPDGLIPVAPDAREHGT